MDVSQELSFDTICLKHLLCFLTEIKTRYFYKGFNPDEITTRILRNLLNISYHSGTPLNWGSLSTTSDFYQIKNLTNFDSKNSEIALLIVQELKNLRKVLSQEKKELNYKDIADFFLYRLEKNSFFDLHSSSNGSNSPLSGENNNSDMESSCNMNYKLNPLILYEENYNEVQNYDNLMKHTGKAQSAANCKRKKGQKHEKLEKKKKITEGGQNKEKESKIMKEMPNLVCFWFVGKEFLIILGQPQICKPA